MPAQKSSPEVFPSPVSLAHSGMDGVIENHERSDRAENADELNQPNPNIFAAAQ